MWQRVIPIPPTYFWHQFGVSQSWHFVLRENLRLHRFRAPCYKTAPPPRQMQSQLQVLSCAPGGSSRVQRFRGPFLGSINLLTELRNVLLIRLSFYNKRLNSGTARWKMCLKQGEGKGHELPCPPQIPTCSPTWKLSKSVLWVFTEASLQSDA